MPTEPESPLDPPLYESVIERRIREAMERGEFDHLPGSGKPIEGLNVAYDPEWWLKRWVTRENLTDLRRELVAQRTRETVRLRANVDPAVDSERLAHIEARITAIDERLH